MADPPDKAKAQSKLTKPTLSQSKSLKMNRSHLLKGQKSMLDFFKPKDKIDASPSVSKPITQSVSCTSISETSDIEPVSQGEVSTNSTVDDIIVEKQPSKDDIDLVHIEDEFILEPHIFKFLCFFKPTSDGKLKCQLPHVRKKRLSLKKTGYILLCSYL